ncbi:5594_t:CDS:2 [Funneliformis mosseae]|uniref:5594_t:CDS:1 n=1 Tax=Funneliformis mosseae TaxID=27381 RepID=A0A9N9G8Q5_FUNMO|nr:5594_t:CDS:2 [Funneliformis mosseae]
MSATSLDYGTMLSYNKDLPDHKNSINFVELYHQITKNQAIKERVSLLVKNYGITNCSQESPEKKGATTSPPSNKLEDALKLLRLAPNQV